MNGAVEVKLALVRLLQRRLINPPLRMLFAAGLLPPGYALLETTGRRSGMSRRTPVGDGLIGDTFWIVAEHGRRAAYVRNLQADPRVRVQVRTGLRTVWREGTARVLDDDDPRGRQRALAATSVNRRLNAFVVRAMGTELVTVRVDLEATAGDARLSAAKARLDRLALYPAPVRIERVALVVAPWLFALPWFRRFDGYATWNVILVRSPAADGELVCHELCHVWQMQHHPVGMPLSYLRHGYASNPYEREAREAVSATG
jgi:deazaflavin-dependent oxidoreductase (nitroreductase family)